MPPALMCSVCVCVCRPVIVTRYCVNVAGDSWAPVSFDTGLEGNSCQGSLISTANLSNTLCERAHPHPSGSALTSLLASCLYRI